MVVANTGNKHRDAWVKEIKGDEVKMMREVTKNEDLRCDGRNKRRETGSGMVKRGPRVATRYALINLRKI